MPPLQDEIFHKALSSDIRRGILVSLAKKEKYLSEISNEIEKKPQTVDFHLNLLEESGLIDSEWKEGKKYYFLKDRKMPHHKPIPPHALPIKNENKIKFLFMSFIFSSLFTIAFALALKFFEIPINVIIPSTAPVWMGTLTIGYMVQIEK